MITDSISPEQQRKLLRKWSHLDTNILDELSELDRRAIVRKDYFSEIRERNIAERELVKIIRAERGIKYNERIPRAE